MQIKYDNPSMPPGTEVAVHRLGVLVNGESVEIPEEQLQDFALEKDMSLGEALATIPFTDTWKPHEPEAKAEVLEQPTQQVVATAPDENKEGGE